MKRALTLLLVLVAGHFGYASPKPITGYVQNADGTPAVGAQVRVYVRAAGFSQACYTDPPVWTDVNGHYSANLYDLTDTGDPGVEWNAGEPVWAEANGASMHPPVGTASSATVSLTSGPGEQVLPTFKLPANVAYAGQTPVAFNYQGRLVENGQLVNQAAVSISISLYDAATGGTTVYGETDSVGVIDGLYNTVIGDNQSSGTAASLADALNRLGSAAWLGIKVGADPELTPRHRLLSSPFAINVRGLYVAPDDKVGVGTSNPTERLHVSGAAVLGDSDAITPVAGTIRWTGSDFEGYTGSQWVSLTTPPVPPDPYADMVLIPGGINAGTDPDFGAYSLTNASAFYMDQYEVTKAQWDEVATWAAANGYDISVSGGLGKAASHPVQTVSWYECVKWCNARSQMNGLEAVYYTDARYTSVYKTGQVTEPFVKASAKGYRLPTDVEWEYSARGGLSGQRFPWGANINHDYANYQANGRAFPYDTSPYAIWTSHPNYTDGGHPFTSPVGDFAANGFGLYDIVGNVWEWCYDWYLGNEGSARVMRGGGWIHNADDCRVAVRNRRTPGDSYHDMGFRAVLPPGQQ